jgi:hypothetical protein
VAGAPPDAAPNPPGGEVNLCRLRYFDWGPNEFQGAGPVIDSCYTQGMSNNERRPEPNWRLLAIIFCVVAIGVALALIAKRLW